MRCVWLLLVGVGGVELLGGCVSSAARNHSAAVAVAGVVPAEQRFRAGDRIRVTVFGEDRLTGEYEVGGAGAVSLPLTGPAQAAGLTQGEFQQALSDKLRKAYLKDPRVSVDLVSTRPFYILGEVEKPGEYPYRNGLDIWRAMALAGGQTYRASTSTVAIQRAGETEFRDYNMAADVAVGPGDVVRVPERWF